MSPYRPLDVLYGGNKIDGSRWFVRDEEIAAFWPVEYVGKPGRLTCWCSDGEAFAESPDSESPCQHVKAVVDERMAQNTTGRPPAPISISGWCD